MRRQATLPKFTHASLVLACCHSMVFSDSALSQQPTIQYVYDALNRLIAVVDQQGNAALYTYDAMGNILRIDRVNAAELPGRVAIAFVTPSKGKVEIGRAHV